MYHHDKTRKKEQQQKRIILVCVALLVLLFSFASVRRTVHPVSVVIVKPFIFIADGISTGLHTVGAYFHTKTTLQNQIDALTTENETLKEKSIAVDALATENAHLQTELGRTPSGHSVLGRILAKPNISPYDTLLIDIGSNDGVYVGALVSAGSYVVLGTISEVTPTTSVVSLFSTAGTQTTGRIEGKNIDVTLNGRGGGNFVLSLPSDMTLDTGTRILFPGNHLILLALVGLKDTTTRVANNTYLLTTPLNINELDTVFVEKK